MDSRLPLGSNALKVVTLSLLAFINAVHAADTYQLTWSDKTYGPDGPWHAIKTWIGHPRVQVDLLPAALWASEILDASNCDGLPGDSCPMRRAGLYTPHKSTTRFRVHTVPPSNNITWSADVQQTGQASNWADIMYLGNGIPPVTNASLLVDRNIYSYSPGGKRYQPPIGQLSLGAPARNQTFNQANNVSIVTNILPNAEYDPGYIRSPSFGLHIGSAVAGIPGSLWLGGYDRERALGKVASRPPYSKEVGHTQFGIDLTDLSLESAPGTSSTRLLGNLAPFTVGISPWTAYIEMPKEVCDSMTATLPVHYSKELGYYLWNITDDSYQFLVGSSSWFTFSFDASFSGDDTLEIKMPLQLFNLTLEAPIVDQPTPYFPCIPSPDGEFRLGRAFLQAAFFGVNWREAVGSGGKAARFFLAQAPGPSVAATPFVQNILDLTSHIKGSTTNWESTWERYWIPAGSNTGLSPTIKGTYDAGLSTGAEAGIGIGVALGVLLVVGALAWFILRRRRRPKEVKPKFKSNELDGDETSIGRPVKEPVKELHNESAFVEADGTSKSQELSGDSSDTGSRYPDEKSEASPDVPAINDRPAELE